MNLSPCLPPSAVTSSSVMKDGDTLQQKLSVSWCGDVAAPVKGGDL